MTGLAETDTNIGQANLRDLSTTAQMRSGRACPSVNNHYTGVMIDALDFPRTEKAGPPIAAYVSIAE